MTEMVKMFVHFFRDDQFMGFVGSASSGSLHQTSRVAAASSVSAPETDDAPTSFGSMGSVNASSRTAVCVFVFVFA